MKTSVFEFDVPEDVNVEKIDVRHQQTDFFESPLGVFIRSISRFIWRQNHDIDIDYESVYTFNKCKCTVNISSVRLEASSPSAREMLKDFIESQTKGVISIDDLNFRGMSGAQYKFVNNEMSSVHRWFKAENCLLQISIISSEAPESKVSQVADQVLSFLVSH